MKSDDTKNEMVAAIPSSVLEIEMLTRAITRGETAIAAAELSLAQMRENQTARHRELNRQLTKGYYLCLHSNVVTNP